MDYTEEQRLRTDLKQAKEDAFAARQLVEAMTRKHAEQDANTAILTARIARLEKILKVEIENAEKDTVVTGVEKKGIIDRMLGR